MKLHLKIIKGYEDHNHYLKGKTYREFTDFEETPNFDEFISYIKTHNGNMFFKEENIEIKNFNDMLRQSKGMYYEKRVLHSEMVQSTHRFRLRWLSN